MALFRTDALSLRRQNLGEADRIVIFLSRDHGKLRTIAHSARRAKSKLAGAVEPLTFSHLEYYGKENADLFHLKSADVLRDFDSIRRNYEKLQNALVMAEALDRLLETGETQPEIFTLSLAVLERMESALLPDDPMILFKIRLLGELGYQPNLDACADCGRPLEVKGAVYRQGQAMLFCPDCSAGGVRLSPGAVKHLSAVSSLPLVRAFQLTTVRATQGEVSRFLDEFLTQVCGSRLKSLKFLKSWRSTSS